MEEEGEARKRGRGEDLEQGVGGCVMAYECIAGVSALRRIAFFRK